MDYYVTQLADQFTDRNESVFVPQCEVKSNQCCALHCDKQTAYSYQDFGD